MKMAELLRDLESLVEAIEDSNAVIAGTIAEATHPGRVLRHLMAGRHAMETNHGANEWRDRLLRSAVRIVALKARTAAQDDPELADLIASVLQSPVAKRHKH